MSKNGIAAKATYDNSWNKMFATFFNPLKMIKTVLKKQGVRQQLHVFMFYMTQSVCWGRLAIGIMIF